MVAGVVVAFDPVGELAVEGFEGGEVELSDEELIADAAEKAFDFALGGSVADGGVSQDAADAGADQGDLLAAVDGAVVDEQLFGDAAFVEGGADGLHQGVDVFLEEELAVAQDAAGVVEKGDELRLFAACAAGVEVRPEHGVGLPELVGVFHAEGEAFFVVLLRVGSEQVVVAQEAVEGGLGDAVGVQETLFDAEAIEGALVGALLVEVGLGGVQGFEEFLGGDLADLALVATRVLGHAGDAVVFVAVEPGLDGAPGEAAGVALFVEEGHGGDVVDAFVAGTSVDGVDGAEDAHLQIDRGLLHEVAPGLAERPNEGRLQHKRARPPMTACVVGRWNPFHSTGRPGSCAANLVTLDRPRRRDGAPGRDCREQQEPA